MGKPVRTIVYEWWVLHILFESRVIYGIDLPSMCIYIYTVYSNTYVYKRHVLHCLLMRAYIYICITFHIMIGTRFIWCVHTYIYIYHNSLQMKCHVICHVSHNIYYCIFMYHISTTLKYVIVHISYSHTSVLWIIYIIYCILQYVHQIHSKIT